MEMAGRLSRQEGGLLKNKDMVGHQAFWEFLSVVLSWYSVALAKMTIGINLPKTVPISTCFPYLIISTILFVSPKYSSLDNKFYGHTSSATQTYWHK